MLTPVLLTNRKQQQQHNLTPASASDAPAQLMHTTAAYVGQQGSHTRAHTHTHGHIRTRTHIQTQTRARTHTDAHSHMKTYKHTDTHAQTHRHARAHTHTHTHTDTHAYEHTLCTRDGLRQLLSVTSDAPSLVDKHSQGMGEMWFYKVFEHNTPRVGAPADCS